MSRDEALTAVLNAARAVRQSGLRDVRLDQLYSAIDAYDTVGTAAGDVSWDQAAPDYRAARGCLPLPPGALSPEAAIRRGRDAGFCQADPDCWRRADTADGVCYHHTKTAQAERVRAVATDSEWQQARPRDAVFETREADG